MKVVITNTVAFNAGDAAILFGAMKLIRQAIGDDAQFLLLDRYGKAPGKYFTDLNFDQFYITPFEDRRDGRFTKLWKRFEILRTRLRLPIMPAAARRNVSIFRDADLVVATGGTYLVEHYNLDSSFLNLWLAINSGKPVCLFTQSLGPFNSARNIEWLKRIIPRARLVLLRDERSQRHLREVTDSNNTVVLSDAAFALSDLDRLEQARKRHFPGTSPKIVISVRNWRFPGHSSPRDALAAYRECMRAVTEHLVRKYHATITFASTCQGAPEYWTDDSAEATLIAEGLPPDVASRVTVDRSFRKPNEIIDFLADMDLVISTRMHMAILALCAGTPVLPIAYEFKTEELFSGMNLGDWVQNISAMSPADAVALVDRYIGQLDELRPHLVDATLKQRESAFTAVGHLRRVVDSKN